MRRLFNAVVISLLMTVLVLPIFGNNLVFAANPSGISEIIGLRTENTKTYELGNGSRQLVASIGAVHYKNNYADKSEVWKDIDLTWEGNRITKAPYELTLDGQKITVKDKRTGEVSTIELLSVFPASMKFEIVPEHTRVSFRHILPSDKIPFEASFRITGKGLITTKAFDDEGELELETSLVDDILTEKLTSVKDKTTGAVRPAKGSIKVDPTWQVGASTDDCYRIPTPNYWATDYGHFQAGYVNSTYPDLGSAARFIDFTVPSGSTILTAILTLTCSSPQAKTAVNTRIRAEQNINSVTFSTKEDFDARTWTTAYINWDAIPAFVLDTEYNSSDFAAVVQEVIDLASWASGNPITILWDDFGKRSTQEIDANRPAYSYDSSTTKGPKLVVTYTVPLAAPTVTTSAATAIEATTATLDGNVTATGGENPTVTVYWGDNDGGQVAGNWDNNSIPTSPAQPQGVAAFYKDVTSLSPDTLYYFSAKGTNSAGTGWGTTQSFTTLDLLPPTALTLADLGAITINADWIMGTGSTYTMLRVSRTDYPGTPTAGELFYYGDAVSANSTGYALDLNTFYVSAWGFAGDNTTYSATYATATIGGDNMETLAGNFFFLVLVLLAISLTVGMFVTKQMMLGFPSAIFWFILGGYCYQQSAATWDIYYLIFFGSFGMGIFSIFAAYALRTKREDAAEGDLYFDEGGDDDVKFIDEGGGKGGGKSKTADGEPELDDENPSRRTREIRDRANRRRTRWE